MSETSFELSEKAASRVGWQSFGVDGPPFEPFRFSNVVKVMELHADVAALWLSIDLAKNSACHGARLFTDLAEDLQSLNAPRELAYTEMHTDRVCHYLLFSSLICVGLFEFARLHEADGPSDSHPLPEARLINLANYVFYGSDLAEPAPNGGYWINMPSHYKSDDWPDSPWNRFLNDAMAAAAQDFSQLCNLIGLDLHLFRTREQIDETNPDTLMEKEPLLNAWFQDAMSLHNIPLAAHYDVPHEFRPKSSGGAEIKTLFDYHEPVEVLTESLQKRTNGAVLSFALS